MAGRPPSASALTATPIMTPSIEARMGRVEAVLSRLIPHCLVDENVRSSIIPLNLSQQRLYPAIPAAPQRSSPLAIDPQPRIKEEHQQQQQQQQQPHGGRSSFKTGGFLVCAEDYPLTFWGSTSALGGTASKSHIYKSIPRFANGVLQSVPYASSSEGKSPTVSASTHSQSATPQAFYEGATSSANSFMADSTTPKQQQPSLPPPPPPPISISIFLNEEESEEQKTFHELIPLPQELVDHILHNFWEQFHPQFPILEKSWFTTQLNHVRTLEKISLKTHWRFILVLLSVVSLMINFTPSLSHWPSSPSSSSSSAYANPSPELSARRLVAFEGSQYLFEHFETPDIYMVQSLVMMRGWRITAVWGYMGMAVRISQELGLHRSISELGVQHQRLDPETMAIRNRTWHCVMIMETYTCIWTGRPLAIHENDWDAEYPAVTSPDLQTLQHHIDLAQIIASILRFANRAREVNVPEVISNIQTRLDAWPSSLSWNQQTSTSSDNNNNNPNFPANKRWTAKESMSLMTIPSCLTAAESITNLVSRFEHPLSENECVALFPTFTYCAMMACTVHISQMLSPPPTAAPPALHSTTTSSSSQRLVDSVSNLEKVMRVFDCLRSVFVDAERCWKTILDFLTVKGVRLEDLVEAGKNGSAVAAAVAGMNELVGGGGAGAGGDSIANHALSSDGNGFDVNNASGIRNSGDNRGGVGFGTPADSALGLGPWPPSGFFNEAVARTTSEKTSSRPNIVNRPQKSKSTTYSPSSHQPFASSAGSGGPSMGFARKGPVNGVKAIQTMGSSFSSPGNASVSATGIMNGGLGTGDLGFVWDGLSLFDLAGLDFSMMPQQASNVQTSVPMYQSHRQPPTPTQHQHQQQNSYSLFQPQQQQLQLPSRHYSMPGIVTTQSTVGQQFQQPQQQQQQPYQQQSQYMLLQGNITTTTTTPKPKPAETIHFPTTNQWIVWNVNYFFSVFFF
ncbi:fungal-specific transcription factor domain-containing protein [Obelidium mucronatum]|nr:fungal-specific transcription factor domain-containing protein [Obelidium mucronatum]